MSHSGRPLRKYSARQVRACRKRQSSGPSRRRLLRRDLELARNVAALLRETAESVRIALHFVDMRVTLVVQRPEQFAHALEDSGEIGGLFILGVGSLADMDVEPEAGEALLRQRPAAGEPVGGIDVPDDDGGDLGVLAQYLGGQVADGIGNFR